MINIDLKALVGKLNEPSRQAAGNAAGLCLNRTHYNVEVEHWLLKLIEMTDSDIQAILIKYEVNLGKLARDLNQELDRIKSGNTRAPPSPPPL